MLGIAIVVGDICRDRLDEVLHTGKGSAAYAPAGDLSEESLHHVQPRRAGWREVEVESLMSGQPRLNVRMLVRSVIVENDCVRKSV